jgi:hypothetical protein
MALTRRDLDITGCSFVGCTHEHDAVLHIHGKCHPHAHIAAEYDKGTGTIRFSCMKCKKLITEIEVAP